MPTEILRRRGQWNLHLYLCISCINGLRWRGGSHWASGQDQSQGGRRGRAGRAGLPPQTEATPTAHRRDSGIPEAVLEDLVHFFTLDFWNRGKSHFISQHFLTQTFKVRESPSNRPPSQAPHQGGWGSPAWGLQALLSGMLNACACFLSWKLCKMGKWQACLFCVLIFLEPELPLFWLPHPCPCWWMDVSGSSPLFTQVDAWLGPRGWASCPVVHVHVQGAGSSGGQAVCVWCAAGEGAEWVKRPLAPSEARFTLSCLSGLNGRSGGETEFTQKLTDSTGCEGGVSRPGQGGGPSCGETPHSRSSGDEWAQALDGLAAAQLWGSPFPDVGSQGPSLKGTTHPEPTSTS